MVDEELTTDPLAQAPPESEPNIRNQTLTPQEDSLETSDSGDLVQQGSEESFPASDPVVTVDTLP